MRVIYTREWSLIPRWMTLSLHHYRCLRFPLDLFASIGNWFDSVIGQQARSNRLVNGSVSQFSVQKLSFKNMVQLSLYLSSFYFIYCTCCPPWHTTQRSFVQQSWNTHFIPLETSPKLSAPWWILPPLNKTPFDVTKQHLPCNSRNKLTSILICCFNRSCTLLKQTHSSRNPTHS